MALIIITPPAVEPVTVSEVKDSARIDGAALDAQIAILIAAFRAQAEHTLGRRLITQTVELALDAFPADSDIDLLLPDVQSIVSVTYYDESEALQTIAADQYSLDAISVPCWLLAVDGWPATADAANVVRVRYVAGYGDAPADVPDNIRSWIIAQVCAAIDKQTPAAWLDRLLDAGMVHQYG